MTEDTIAYGAKQLTGFSDEQVDELSYLDDDDPRIKQWEFAKRIAENAVYNNYIAEQVARQQASDNFAAIQQFAANDFFNAQSDLDSRRQHIGRRR